MTGNLTNNGQLTTPYLTVGGLLTNNGNIWVPTSATVTGTLDNYGTINIGWYDFTYSDMPYFGWWHVGSLTISGSGTVINEATGILTVGETVSAYGWWGNNGNVGSFTIQDTGSFINYADNGSPGYCVIGCDVDLSASGTTFINYGGIDCGGNVTVNALNTFDYNDGGSGMTWNSISYV